MAAPTSKPDLSFTAIGRQHHPIETKNEEAQAYFDQGITFLYGFNLEEAERAFRWASELDPRSPMPLWGIALAIGPYYNGDVDARREKLAYETIQKALRLAAQAPQVEKDYVTALAVRYSSETNPDYKKLAQDYAVAMRDLSRKYPDDLDAATLYAESLMDLNPWKLWSHDGRPGENTEEIIRTLESVLDRDPLHAGANHYYIHAVEASPRPERALPSARRLGTLVPGAGHLVHMPAHIYMRTGDFAAAAQCNELAAESDRAYAEKAGVIGSAYDLHYHSHNEHFLAAAASMEGRYAEAKKAADRLASRLAPHLKMMPGLAWFAQSALWVDVRFSRWQEILGSAEPPREAPNLHAFWHYARGAAYAGMQEVEHAKAERDALSAEVEAMPETAHLNSVNLARNVFRIATAALDARIAAARGNKEEAITHWRRAVEAQDALNYDEPPGWYYPVRESLGAALLSAGQPAEAEKVFREDLSRNPRNPRSLFGLAEVLRVQKKNADAMWVQRAFDAAWKDADTILRISDL